MSILPFFYAEISAEIANVAEVSVDAAVAEETAGEFLCLFFFRFFFVTEQFFGTVPPLSFQDPQELRFKRMKFDAAASASSASASGLFYDGMGGHSKADLFPNPSAPARFSLPSPFRARSGSHTLIFVGAGCRRRRRRRRRRRWRREC